MASIQEIVARRAPVASLPQASPNPNVGVGLISDAGSAGFRQLGQVRGISLDTATGFGQAMATDAQTFGMVGEVVGQIATVVDELNEASEKARLVSAGNLADKKIKHWNSIADETEREEYRLKDVEPALAKIRTQRKNLISIADNSRNALIAEMGTLGNAHKLNAAKSRGYMELAKLRSELDAAKGSEKIEIGKRYGALSDTFITTGALDPKEAYLLGRDTQNILKASQNSVVSDELTSFYSNSNLTTRALGELRAKLADGKTTVPKDHPLYSIEKYATDNLGVTELLKIADAAYANRVKGKKDFNDSVAIEDQASFNELVSSGVVRDITKKVNSISSGVINVGGLMTATEELNKMKASYLKANGYSAKLEAEIDSQIRSAQAYMTKIVELGGRQMRPEINSWLMARSKKDQSTYAEKFMLARGDIDEAKKVVSELRQEPGFNKTVLSKLSNDDLAATLSGNPELIDKALTSSKLPLAYKVETLKKAIKAQHDLEVAGKSPYQKKSPDKAEAKFLSDIDNVMNDDNLSNKGKEEKINKIDEQFQDYIKPVAGNIKKSVDVQIETEGAVFELSNLTGNLIRSDNFAGLVYEKGKSKEDKVRDEKIVEDALRKTTEHYMGEGYTAQQASAIALNLFENAKNEIKDVLEVPDFTKIPNVPDNSLKPEDVRDAFGGENTDTGLPSASKGLSDSIERVANAVPETLGVQRLDEIVVTPESFEDKVAAAKAMEFGGENTKWNKDTQSWDLVEEDKTQAPMPNDDGIVLTDQERSRGNFSPSSMEADQSDVLTIGSDSTLSDISQGAQGGGEQFDPRVDLESIVGKKLKISDLTKEQWEQIRKSGPIISDYKEILKHTEKKQTTKDNFEKLFEKKLDEDNELVKNVGLKLIDYEGNVKRPYLDTENVLTFGLGFTGKEMILGNKSVVQKFKELIPKYISRAKDGIIGSKDKWDNLSSNLKTALAVATYRGDIAEDHYTSDLLRSEEWENAAEEFTDHSDLRDELKRQLLKLLPKAEDRMTAFKNLEKDSSKIEGLTKSLTKEEVSSVKKKVLGEGRLLERFHYIYTAIKNEAKAKKDKK